MIFEVMIGDKLQSSVYVFVLQLNDVLLRDVELLQLLDLLLLDLGNLVLLGLPGLLEPLVLDLLQLLGLLASFLLRRDLLLELVSMLQQKMLSLLLQPIFSLLELSLLPDGSFEL